MKAKCITYSGVIFLLLAGVMHAQISQGSKEEREAVIKTAEQFYSALNAMFTGNLEPMKEVWSHADDVTYLGPDGSFRIGWTKVLKDWEMQAALKLGGEVSPKDMQVTVGRDLAVVSNYELGENIGPNGEPRYVEIRATNLFRKENGKWKMIGHHTDTLPFLKE